ncbi:MAG: hypothetical protein IJW25_00705 [Clostridia bacterium]|nr:hypothetical protein [Clostridia bacterium]
MQLFSLIASFFNGASLASEDPTGSTSGNWGNWEFLREIVNAIDFIMIPIMVLVGTAGLIYAVVLGVNLARAESADKIKEAKTRMVNAIIGLVSIIVLCLLLWLFIGNVDVIFGFIDADTIGGTEEPAAMIGLAMGL